MLGERKASQEEDRILERETGFEPATLALARRCSTTELFPLDYVGQRGGILLSRNGAVKQSSKPIPIVIFVTFVTMAQERYQKVTLSISTKLLI